MDTSLSTSAPAWLLHWVFWFINTTSSTRKLFINYIERLKTAAMFLYVDEEYIFIHNSVFPYANRAYTVSSPSLIYNVNKRLFYSTAPFSNEKQISLPILSIEIINKMGTVVYDLTDFIESVYRVASLNHTLSIGHIISVWQLSSKTILDPSELDVRYVNLVGDTINTDLRNIDSLFN